MAKKSTIPPFDITNAISLLTGGRKPAFQSELEIAIVSFSTWLHWPNISNVTSCAQVVAAANIYSNGSAKDKHDQNTSNPFLTTKALANAVLDFPLEGTYEDAFERANDAVGEITDIISFFMHCPEDLKPSLLKALFFIEEGGFLPDDTPVDDHKLYKKSISTLKLTWAAQAIAGPFVWAAAVIEDNSVLELAPDAPKSVKLARKLLQKPEFLARYFGVAKFCQDKLLDRLDPKSIARFRFVKFPKTVKAIDPEIGAFDQQQIDIVKRYRAPKSI